MKYLLKFLPYAGSLLFSYLAVKFSRYITSFLPFLSAFDADNITDMICAIVPFFAGITVEFFKAKKEKELLKEEHEHQLAMQTKEFENEQKQRDDAHEAAIAQMEANFALELENQRLIWEREDRKIKDSDQKERLESLNKAYTEMTDAVSEYINKHDVNFKTGAEKAIRRFRRYTNGTLYNQTDNLLSTISKSYAFDGPNKQEIDNHLRSIEQHLPDQSADHKEEHDHQYSF